MPQGSILGPLLFTLYTSQLTNNLEHASVHLYADDTQLYMSFPPEHILDINNILTNDLNLLLKNSIHHCLELNPKKCQALLFGRSQSRDQFKDQLHLSLNNEVIKCSPVARNLGLLLDVNLRFSEHISSCIKKAFGNLKLIFNQRHLLSLDVKKSLCESLVLSQFSFCDTLYGPCLLERDVRRIQLIQNCCVRMIGGIRRFDRGVSDKMREIGWLNMAERRVFHSLVLYNKIIFKKEPDYLYKKIKFRYDAHTLDLRYKMTITPPLHRTSLLQRSFGYQVSLLYNKIPVNFKNIPPERFKNSIRCIIQQICANLK